MTDTRFVPGQRWVSATEAELGLGMVEAIDGRLVLLRFPAVDEQRTYAVDNAPLGRVQYAVGDRIATIDGLSFVVTALQERAGLLFYLGERTDGSPLVVPEPDLDSAVRFSKPQDRLFAGQIDRNRLFTLRAEALEHRHRHHASPAFGLLGPRVQLLPHQIYIASQVGARSAPRVLLADEVGLGKTIEAGLIAHQQLQQGRVRRVLVLVPEPLLHQWLVEMLRRFGLRFSILDVERCVALEASGQANPFEAAQLVLAPLALLSEDATRLAQCLAAGWDMLVVDEAHHLRWQTGATSPEYAAVETLAAASPAVLLLTATPEQLGVDGHFARLRLLDPHRYPDLARFRAEAAAQQPLSTLVETLLDCLDSSGDGGVDGARLAELHDAVAAYLGEAAAVLLDAATRAPTLQRMEALIDQLLDRHGVGRVLFRNTRAAIGGFPTRRLHAWPLTPAPTGTATDLAGQLHPEITGGEGWLRSDPRVAWLRDFLAARRQAKVLVIAARDDTARALEEHLRLGLGVRSAVFHAGLGLVARDRAAAYFAEAEDGAQVLVCSELGSEGRNFQFAHDLVLFDLPLEPDLLEQRIGRLDRIGQTETVRIHVPHHAPGAQARLLRWYHEGLNAFEQPCAIGERLAEEFASERLAGLDPASSEARFEALLEATARRAAALRSALQAGRDRLIERNSCRPARATEVVRHVLDAGRPTELAEFLERLFDHAGVEQQPHGPHSVTLLPGVHMQQPLPGLPEEGISATFSRAEALQREDLQFLTWEHPLVEAAMELLLEGDAGNTALCTVALDALPTGALLLEARFALHCSAPRHLQVTRFLPAASLRVVCDERGRDLSSALGAAGLARIARSVPARNAHELVKHTRRRISTLVAHAERIAAPQREPLLAEAVQRARALHGAELERLRALAPGNPAVRAEEVLAWQRALDEVQARIGEATLALDAIRVVVNTAAPSA